MKQQGRDVAPEAAAVAFLLCWPKQITGASWNRNTLLSNLESWNNRIRQLIGFFSYPYGVGRGRKVAIVRILLLRRSSVPLWAALLGTCITEQSLLQCMGLHWECARTKRLMLPKLWMITSPFLPAWIGHNACCPVYAALLHLSPTPLLCGVFFFFSDAFRHSKLRAKQMLIYPIWKGAAALLLLPHEAPAVLSAWLNMSIYTYLALLTR